MKPTVLPRDLALVSLMVAAQLADLVTFLIGVRHTGPQAELNPLVRTLYVNSGALGPSLLKVATLGLIVYLLIRVSERYHLRGAIPAALVVVLVGLVGVWGNVTALAG